MLLGSIRRTIAIGGVPGIITNEEIGNYLKHVHKAFPGTRTTDVVLFQADRAAESTYLDVFSCAIHTLNLSSVLAKSKLGGTDEDHLYISLVIALDGIDDLVFLCADMSVVDLDVWLDAALGAGVLRYHLCSLNDTNGHTCTHSAYAYRKLRNFIADSSIFRWGGTKPWLMARPAKITYHNIGDTTADISSATYRVEIDNRIGLLICTMRAIFLQSERYFEELPESLIQDRVDHLHGVVRRLRGFRNFLTPINSCLPPEILSRIFIHASDQDDVYENYPPSLAWIKVSHVCRHWSNLSRNDPMIWTNISAVLPAWTEELLRRSQSCPLTVHFVHSHRIPHAIQYQALEIALQSLDRIVKLSLTIDHMQSVNLDRPAPLLESFSYRTFDGQGTSSLHPTFGGVTPQLRHVSLHSLLLHHICCTTPRGLSSLELRNIAFASAHFAARFVSNVPGLEFLLLSSSLPTLQSRTRTLPRPKETYKLGALQKLSICDSDVVSCVDFLKQFTTNSIVKNTLTLHLEVTFPTLASDTSLCCKVFFEAVARYIPRSRCPLKSIRLSEHKKSGMLIECWGKVEGSIVPLNEPSIYLWLRSGPLNGQLMQAILGSACSYLPLGDVELLSIIGLDLKPTLSTRLCDLPGLHTVRLCGSHAQPLLSAMMPRLAYSDLNFNDTLCRNILPGLRILLFAHVFFDMVQLATLTKVLIQRRQGNMGLTHLHFDRCRGVSQPFVLAIRNVVDNVGYIEWKDYEDDE